MKRKYLYLTLMLVCIAGITGCSYDELPPKTDDVSSNYQIPKGEIPTQEERDLVEALKKEYAEAIPKR